MAQLDMAIRGGTLVDGTGAPGRPGDIGIRDGKIAAIGEVDGAAAHEIDATGCVVAPGFIDIHTHYDAQAFWDPLLSVSPTELRFTNEETVDLTVRNTGEGTLE